MSDGTPGFDGRLVALNEQDQEIVLYEPDPALHQPEFHASNVPNVLALGTRGTGKAVALDTPIPTPKGYRQMAELAVGDQVLDEQGVPTRIVWKSEPHHDHTGTYRLTFDDGSQIVCGGQHEWWTLNKQEATRSQPVGSIKTTKEIVQTLKTGHGRETNHRVPLGGAWQLPEQSLPIDPYVLGVWLGDGSTGSGQITSADPAILESIRRVGYRIKKLSARYLYGVKGLASQLRALDAVESTKVLRGVCNACHQQRALAARHLCFRCYAVPETRGQHPKAHKGFRRYTGGVLHQKRIPMCYLLASESQRLALLQGLLDTDGSCDRRQGSVEFSNTNKRLAEGVFHLAVSLGLKPTLSEGRATLYGRDCGPKYRVCWTGTCQVFRLSRKLKHLPVRCRTTQSYRYIVSAERVEDQSVQCIQVENESHLYLVGRAAIPTHNSLQLRMDAILRCLVFPNFQALILRRTMPELRRSHLNYIEYEMKMLGGVFLHTTFTAKFPNGSTIVFAHCETEADILNFLSSQYGFIGFDELSTFSLNQFLQISAACRAPVDAPYQAVVRAGSNPLGIGAEWMYQWFVHKTVRVEDFPDYNPYDYQMIFSKLEDNRHLDRDRYAARLKNLPEHVRRAWLLGEYVAEGAYFSDFQKTKGDQPWHVTPSIPLWKGHSLFEYSWMQIYRAVDWGYFPDPAVCLWIAVLPNGRAMVFKERTWRRTLAADVAAQIKKESAGFHIVETFCDPTMMIKEGQTYSISELFEQNGVPLTPATNDRALYGYAVHNYLNTLIDELPQLQIVQPLGLYGCPELIRTFPQLQMDKHDPRKIANGEDHWVVALSYFCMGMVPPSRDPVVPTIPHWMRPKPRKPRQYS